MLRDHTEGDQPDRFELTFIEDVFFYLWSQTKYAACVAFNPKMYTYQGIRIPLRATPELQRLRRNIYRGQHERKEMETIRHLLRSDDIVLELGAGAGIISAFIAQRLSDSRNLHTLEPNPQLLNTIDSIAAANGVTPNVLNAAVGTQDGKQAFFFAENFLASSAYDRGQNAKKTMVQVMAMSALLERIRPTFIVFDIEGAEQDVLTVPIPPEVRVLCGELHPHIIGNHAASDVIRSIIDSGFVFLADQSQGRAVAFVRPGAA
jgi:FkbM family methyltransferase